MSERAAGLTPEQLLEADAAHLIHPLHNRSAHEQLGPILLKSGKGAVLTDASASWTPPWRSSPSKGIRRPL